MANPACMFEGCEVPAVFVGTFFEDGNTVTVCGNHFVEFAAGTLEAMTGAPVIDFINGIIPNADDVIALAETGPTTNGHTPDESLDHGTAGDHGEGIGRATIADKLAAKHADVTDAEFQTTDAE